MFKSLKLFFFFKCTPHCSGKYFLKYFKYAKDNMDKNKLRVFPSYRLSQYCSTSPLCDTVFRSTLCHLELYYNLICFTNGSLLCLLPETWLNLGTCFPCSPLKRMVLLLPHSTDPSVPFSYHESLQTLSFVVLPSGLISLSLLITVIASSHFLKILVPGPQLSTLAQVLLPS